MSDIDGERRPTRARRAPDGIGMLVEQSRAARAAIIRAKLRPPARSARLVPRPRLYSLLEESTSGPLTLVVAPAGSGKTSLLAGWVRETSLPHAWLTLDATDRDPVQLWRGLLAALEGLAPGCAAAAAGLLRQPGTLHDAVGAVLDELEGRVARDAILVVDDLQLVDDDERVSGSVALFVQHLPAWLHVVVASRRTPRLPVHRLRARGELRELHFPELRFSLDEATEMLRRLAPGLDPDRVAEAASRAGGWAASIQLAALASRSARARPQVVRAGEGGERRMLEDYVWSEILADEDEGVIDVLLSTSVVERIDPGLARVLTSRPEADNLLVLALERGLFVSRLEEDGAFEVHALVREALRAVLERGAPARVARLHSWAAGWDQAHGRTVSALEHWLSAGRPRDALHLLFTDLAPLTEGGHVSTIARVVEAIPANVVADDTAAAVELAWCWLPVDRHTFLREADRLATACRDDPGRWTALEVRVRVLESVASLLRGDWWDAAEQARAAAAGLGDSWWLDPLGRYAWNTVARGVALAERWGGTTGLDEVLAGKVAAAPDRRLALAGTRALGAALAGRPVEALRVVAELRPGPDAIVAKASTAELVVAEAIARCEVGETGPGARILVGLSARPSDLAPYCRLLASLELALVRVEGADLDGAARAFDVAAELVETEMSGTGARAMLGRTGVVLATAAGDPDTARGWAAQVEDPFWSPVSTARILLASGDPGGALDTLKDAEPRCVRHRVVADLLRFRSAADRGYAEECLVDAVRLASSCGLVRTVAVAGVDVLPAVERLAWQVPQGWLARLRRVVVAAAPGAGPDRRPSEALTARELEVLRLLPSRLTLREIADELFISINTLKFHLKVIYRKLDCTSRAEAADVARGATRLRPPAR